MILRGADYNMKHTEALWLFYFNYQLWSSLSNARKFHEKFGVKKKRSLKEGMDGSEGDLKLVLVQEEMNL